MNRFTRPPGRPAGPTKINFAAAKKAILLDPGVYELQIERAELVRRERQHQRCLDAHRHRQRPGRQHQADVGCRAECPVRRLGRTESRPSSRISCG